MIQSLVIVTGMSGSGKSVAIKALEDSGYFCADNLPVVLLPEFIRLLKPSETRVAVVVDIRQPGFSKSDEQLLELLQDHKETNPQLIFLDSNDEVLVRRFSQVRRPHPLNEHSIEKGVERERELLAPFRQAADLVIDTSHLPPHELRLQLRQQFAPTEQTSPLKITIASFGFKHGIPLDMDMLFDVRFLPNPYWVTELRAKSGQDPEIGDYLRKQEGTDPFLDYVRPLLLFAIRQFQHTDRHYLKIAFGCTGGRHRSVFMSEQIHTYLAEQGIETFLQHRDIGLR